TGSHRDIGGRRHIVGSDAHGLFFFSSRRRHTRSKRDWSSDVCSSDLATTPTTRPSTPTPRGRSRGAACRRTTSPAPRSSIPTRRSEERRVGKECRFLWSAYEQKKK